jgi:hypothetical protein
MLKAQLIGKPAMVNLPGGLFMSCVVDDNIDLVSSELDDKLHI